MFGVQAFEPQRSAELKDLLVDSLGICLGLVLARWCGTWVRSLANRLATLVSLPGG